MAGIGSVTSPSNAASSSSGSSSPFVPVAGQGLLASSTGLVSGLQTQQIIQALLTFDQEPVTTLNNKISGEQNQQSAYSTLSSQLTALQNDAQQLSSAAVLGSRNVSSSNSSLLTGSANASAPLASYLVTPVALAQTQELLSNGFANTTSAPVGQGTILVKLGGFVNPATPLAQLNGGAGVAPGKINITDRAGATATIDLSSARTIDDVVNDINQNGNIPVKASLSGGSLVITDSSTPSGPPAQATLTVTNVGNGTTATDLGIAGAVTGNATLTGGNLVYLSNSTPLAMLNDGNGVGTAPGVPDFTINLQDGSSFSVQLGSAATMQDVLNAINNNSQNGGKLTASTSGNHLVLTDHTTGSNTLTVSALNGSTGAKDLGILGSAQSGGVLTGGALLPALDSVLLKDLNGGSGITTPGSIALTDRSGATATVNLANASSLSDVITAINGAGLGLTAAVNAAGDGIQISDTTGKTTSNLIVADVSGGTTAADLHIATDSASNSVNSGDLNERYISTTTALSQLNGGAGVQYGSFQITDSKGKSAVVSLSAANATTVGNVITAINTAGVGVHASINGTGDGILLSDTAGGGGTMQVTDLAGTTAAGLNIAGGAVNGQINGAFRYSVTVGPNDSLSTLQQDFANSKAPITTNILNDGGGSNPYHIMLGSTQSGLAGRLLIDTGTTGLSLATLTPATNAVIQVGTGGGSNLLFTSATNTFTNILPGLTLNVGGTSATPVTVTVGQDTSALTNALQNFVNDFNTVNGTIAQDDNYNTATQTASVLYADPTIRQISNSLMGFITGSFGNSSDQTRGLLQMGITLSNGQLSINSSALQAALAADPAGIQDFLGNASSGMATKLTQALQNITAPYSGSIAQQVNNLNQQISDQQSQVTFLNAQIAAKQTLLQNQFANMESNLATIQSQGNTLSQLANMATFYANYANGGGSGGSSH